MISPKGFLYREENGVATITLNRPERLNALTFDIYRELAAVRPNEFQPDLAQALYWQSKWLAAQDRREDALSADAEMVKIRRELETRSGRSRE